MPGANRIEQSSELCAFFRRKHRNRRIVRCRHLGIEGRQHSIAFRGDVADHLPAIRGLSLPSNKATLLEAIDKAGDAWRLVNHAVPDDQRGHPTRSSPSQDSQDVVLLNRDPALGDDLVVMALEERGRPQNSNRDLSPGRVEGGSLFDLVLKGAPSLGHRVRKIPASGGRG